MHHAPCARSRITWPRMERWKRPILFFFPKPSFKGITNHTSRISIFDFYFLLLQTLCPTFLIFTFIFQLRLSSQSAANKVAVIPEQMRTNSVRSLQSYTNPGPRGRDVRSPNVTTFKAPTGHCQSTLQTTTQFAIKGCSQGL